MFVSMVPLAQTRGFSIQTVIFEALGVPQSPLASLIYSLAIVAGVFIPAIMVFAMFAIWWERKVAGHIQARLGPNRVGPIGILQSLADGIKLLTKEDLTPGDADHFLFKLAPYLAFTPVFVAWLALPFGPEMTYEPRLAVGKQVRLGWNASDCYALDPVQ